MDQYLNDLTKAAQMKVKTQHSQEPNEDIDATIRE